MTALKRRPTVSSMAISWLVFGCIFGGALLGMGIRAVLPKHHLSPDSKDVVKLGMGLIATMSALVLGLLVAWAKFLRRQRSELTEISANVIYFDRTLARYGPETKQARAMLRAEVASALERIGPKTSRGPATWKEPPAPKPSLTNPGVAPKTDVQRTISAQALKLATDVAQMAGSCSLKRVARFRLPSWSCWFSG